MIRIKRQFKSTLNSQKLKFRQISYTLNIIRLQYAQELLYHLIIFNQKWHKASFSEGDSSFFKRRALPLPRENDSKIAKIPGQIYQTWNKASLRKGDLCCSNKGPRLFPMGDNSYMVKIH